MRIHPVILPALFTVILMHRPAAGAGLPQAPAQPAVSGKRFDRLGPDATGLAEVPRIEPGHEKAFLYRGTAGSGSIALGDIDRDGLIDLFIAGAAGPNRLYRQTKPFVFTDITATAGPLIDGGSHWATGSSMVDIDADGDLDIFVCNFDAPCQVFVNTGPAADGSPAFYREAAADFGLNITAASAVPCFCDYDRDGDLDLYLVTGKHTDPSLQPDRVSVRIQNGVAALPPEAARGYEPVTTDGGKTWQALPAGEQDYLFRNEGRTAAGTMYYRDVTSQAGISGRGDGQSAVWWDANGDSWMDLYVSNSGHEADVLYRNERNGRFLKVTAEQLPVIPWHSRTASPGDVDADSHPDLFTGGIAYPRREDRCLTELTTGTTEAQLALSTSPPQEMRSTLFVNSGGSRFAECAWHSSVARTGAVAGAQWIDADHDGALDLILLHGQSRRFGDPAAARPGATPAADLWEPYRDSALQKEPLLAFRNEGDLRFTDSTADWGLDASAAGTSLGAADFDNDGDMDLIMTAHEEAPVIFRNGTVKQNAVTIRLEGPPENPHAVGTTLIARSEKATRWQQLMPGSGGLAQTQGPVHICTGTDAVIQELLIRWPTGAEQRVTSLIGGNAYTFSYPLRPQPIFEEPRRDPFFTKLPALELVRHTDVTPQEFAAQPLLPFTSATAGPPLAWTDLDGDGDHDLFAGGSSNYAGQVRINDGQGKFIEDWRDALQADAAAADAGAVWFDADADGDVDLFAAGGSTGHPVQSAAQRDRLYLNDGKGNLAAAADGTVPQDGQASSIVCAADYDLDGDFDLFCGARAVPADYSAPPSSSLLRNDSAGGRLVFTRIADALQPAPGMVTSAVWTDLDNDARPDLVLAQEWGAVRVWTNRPANRFEEITGAAGLAERTGWWQSVTAADVDNDGAMDLIAGNGGTNSVHRAPVTAFSVRPEGASQRLFLMTEKSSNRLLPQRNPAVLTSFMPWLDGKFSGYAAFAAASVEDLTGRESLEAALRLEAATLASGVFFNNAGKDKSAPSFTFQPLPAAAQLAPVFGCAVSDFDGDGDQDIVLAQNARDAPIEEAQRDGGLCVLLLNDGAGHFSAMPGGQSGLTFSAEHRACTVADVNFDSRPDVVMSVYRGGLAALTNTAPGRNLILRVNIPPHRAPGVRVKVERTGQPMQTAEYSAGGGWLSQSAPCLFFGLGSGPTTGVVTLRWPDGRLWTESFNESKLTLNAPSR